MIYRAIQLEQHRSFSEPLNALSRSERSLSIPRLIRVAPRGVLEVLRSVDPRSPDLRRNTSPLRCESLRGGNRAATCCRLVAALLPLLPVEIDQVATNRQHVAAFNPVNFNKDAAYHVR